MEKRSKHEVKREISYQRFLEAALIVFAEKGYENGSLSEISKKAGYTKGAFYHIFKTKEELFVVILESQLNKFKEKFLSEFYSSRVSSDNAVVEGIRMCLKLMKEDQWIPIFFEFYAQAMRDDKIKKIITEHYQNWVSFITEFIEKETIKKNPLDSLKSEVIARLLIVLVDGFNLQNTLQPESMSFDYFEPVVKRILGID